MNRKTGKVYFIGAGPGDPGLITLKGIEALNQADVIIYDRLASPQLLKHARRDARFIYCGKEASSHTLAQDQIEQLLIEEAEQGRLVVRLKGGDPNIFGRVGEEAEACAGQGIPYEIVPGITSGIAAAAYAGIPLTYRGCSSGVAIVTGHRCAGHEETQQDWEALARMDTIVVYMGVGSLPQIREQLLAHGKPPGTPAALIRWGTTGDQQTLVSTLDQIAAKAREACFSAPAICIIGDVVKLRESLNWHESRPLFGRKILVLQASAGSYPPDGQSSAANVLQELGAEVAEVPVHPVPAPDHHKIAVLNELDQVNRIVFADGWEVQSFFNLLAQSGRDIRSVQAQFGALETTGATELASRAIIPSPAPVRHERELLLAPDYKDRATVFAGGKTAAFANVRAQRLKTSLCGSGAAIAYLTELLKASREFDTLLIADIRSLYALQDAIGQLAELGDRLRRIPEIVCVGDLVAAQARALGWNVAFTCDGGLSISLNKWACGKYAVLSILGRNHDVI